MPASESVSRVFGNTQSVCDDLLRELTIKGGQRDTIGFLVCDSQLEYAALAAQVSRGVDFPVIGGTTLAFPMVDSGDEMSAKLVVCQKQGAEFSVAVSQPLDNTSGPTQVEELYRRCVAGLAGDPKLFFVLVPKTEALNGEQLISDLLPLAGGVPVFGGMTGADVEIARAAVFAGGKTMQREIVLVGIGGNVRPAVAVGTSLTVINDYAPTVTKSEGNVVYAVDDMTFFEYLDKVGLTLDVTSTAGMEDLFEYAPVPALLRGKRPQDDGVPEIRSIISTNPQNESAVFTASVPVGTRVSIGILQKSDIVDSARDCLDKLQASMAVHQEQGYQYDVLFSLSCVARYFAQVGGEDAESAFLHQALPKNLPVGTFYAFSEFCPTLGQDGAVHNRTHSESIVMCAF